MRFKVYLREVAEFQKGFAFKSKDYVDKGTKIVKVSNLTADSIDISQCVCIENNLAKKYITKYDLNLKDIIITTVGSWPTNPASVVGKVVRVPKIAENTLLNQNAVRVRGNERVIQDYLYYLLKDKSFMSYIVGTAQGSANQASITQEDIKNFSFYLPPLEEQKAIADILSSLDEKIELNNQMNETLEEMAQALFKRWFVDFEFPNEEGNPYKSSGGEMVESELGMIPKGWEHKKIIDLPLSVTDYVANGSFASLKANVKIFDTMEYALFIRNTDIKENFKSSKRYVDEHSYNFLSKTKLYGGEVLISNVGDVGSVYLCPYLDTPMTLGNNMIMLNSIDGESLNLYLYRLFKSREGQGLIQSITSGSVQLKFNKTHFRNLSILIPTKQLLQQYVELQKSIETIKFHNIKENEQLSSYRDTVLPKLMSGEIRVSDLEC